MSCLISKFDQFTLNSDDDEEKVLYGYIFKAKSSKNFFACKNVIPDFLDSRQLLCQRKYVTSDNCVICFKCMDGIVFQNLRNIENLISLKKDYCIHAKLCEILFKPEGRGKVLKIVLSTLLKKLWPNLQVLWLSTVEQPNLNVIPVKVLNASM